MIFQLCNYKSGNIKINFKKQTVSVKYQLESNFVKQLLHFDEENCKSLTLSLRGRPTIANPFLAQ